ncbi:MAG: hypothetical protein ACLFQP_05270 [Halothece sp.]
MKNTKFIFVVLGIIILTGVIFFLQNRSPVLPLVFFGTETISFPVGLWLILSAIAGILASTILQLLLGVYPRPNGKSNDWDEPNSPNSPDTTYRVPNPNRYQSKDSSSYNTSERASYTVSNPKASPYDKNDDQDWESSLQGEDWNEVDEEWDIEKPPRRENPPSPNRNDDEDETLYSPPETPRNIYERPQTPEKTSNQQGSVYSYRYRKVEEDLDEQEDDRNNEDEDEDRPSSTQVYEANYRVIRPPLWNLPDEEDDSEQR